MSNDREKRLQERENLRNIIAQWNANRLDLFELSEPNEELEFHGVMRFYFQDSGQKVATKCIRVSSTAGARDVVITLIEKFRPDIRMLSIPEYALYEIHENGDERKLGEEEKPLLVQLNWHKDDREGRFLLRRMDEKSFLPSLDPESRSFRRKLSKREKKEKKKREKRERQKENEDRKDGIAEKLYSELPETSFTRSISNPEAVMRRRRQQKLERKLMQFRQEGGPDAGGTLRIFGESLNRDVPYKTLLLSTRECSAYVVREILDKYAMEDEDSSLYCLVQVILPTSAASMAGELHEYQGSVIREYILDDDDCPLLIEKQHNRSKGILMFHIRRRPADYQPRKRKKKPKPSKSADLDNGTKEEPPEKLPLLLELNPDGSEVVQGPAKKHSLFLNVTEVGCERSSSTSGQHLQLFGPNVQSRHCVIAHTEGIVTVTPSSCDAETYVNGVRIYETTILQHGAIVRFGKLHTFRFVDPLHDERRRLSPDQRQVDYVERNARKEDPLNSHHHSSYETTFDADGNIETVSTHSRDDRMSRKSDDLNSHRSFGREGAQSRGEKPEPRRMMGDAILPAVLEFWEDGEDAFLNAVINQLEPSQVQFKLAPTYILYMAARYRASTHYRPDAQPTDRAMRLTTLMIKIAGHIHQVIQDKYRDSTSLAFWLANTSELLHFLKQDRHLSAYTLDAQDLLAESVQLAFRSLVTCQQGELQMAMQAILEDRDDINEEQGTTSDILGVLSSAMSLLRRCRVNAALTIQLFSQLFHYINMWLVNRVLCELDPPFNLCSRLWGVRLKRRLDRIELWAEKQGLELAADCHLSRIIQAAHLLQAPKSSPEDIAAISSACFKLNSLQLRTLLENYQPVPDEPSIPGELIDTVVKVAQNTADELARSDGREVKLEEDPDLQLPFLLPEDGYSCDIVKGVATGLQDCLQPLVRAGLCRLTVQPSSSGCWKIYMTDQDIGRAVTGANSPSVGSVTGQQSGGPPTGLSQQGDGCSVDQVPTTGGQSGPLVGTQHQRGGPTLPPEPEVMTIKLQKSNSGMGLSIVAARGVGQDKLGIYIKSVVKGGAADQDARLQAGDQLLKVDGQSLIGISQEKAAELMTRTGAVVTLEVAKQGAIYHGLAALLSQPSPVMQRVFVSHGKECSGSATLPHRRAITPTNIPLGALSRGKVPSQSSCDLSSSDAASNPSPVAPQQQWESIQTLDRSSTLSKGKKAAIMHSNSPFTYLNGPLPVAFNRGKTSSQAPSHQPPPRPKSDETLLDGPSRSSNRGWPSGDLECSAGRPRSDESLASHPRNCICEKCCPICRASHDRNMYMHPNPAYGMSFCELLEQEAEEQGCDPQLLGHTPQNSLDSGGAKTEAQRCSCSSCRHPHKGIKLDAYAYGRTSRLRHLGAEKSRDMGTWSRPASVPVGNDLIRLSAASAAAGQPNSLPLTNNESDSGTGPRRMSERDIPSRLVQDQNQQILPPRIQGSKSVPSLNCAPGLQDPPLHPQQQSNRTHDIYNPAYGRNPALISGPKSDLQNTDFDGRTKLTGPQHPTYDSRYAYPAMNNNSYGVNGMNGTLPNRQPPHLPQQPTHPPAGHGLGPAGGHLPHPNSNQSEERHYQNISMYQQQQPNYNAPPRPPSGPFHQRALHGSHTSLMRSDQHGPQGPVVNQTGLPGPQPVMDNKSRPLSTLVSPREQEQYVNSLGYNQGMGQPTSPQRVPQQPGAPFRPGEPHRPPMQQPQYAHRGEFRGPDLTNHLPEDMPDGLKGMPAGHYGPQQHPGGPAMDPRQRDILRQEAKMEEMREEVRRREEREHGHPQGPRPNWAPRGPGPQQPMYPPGQQGYPPQPPYPPNNSYGGGGPRMAAPPGPGPIPKPRYGDRPLWGYEGSDSEKHLMYRESPPPPPPPNSTHPLLQSGTPAPAVSYRYGPSGYPPRPGETEPPFQQQRTGPPSALQPGRTPPQTYGKPQSAMPNRMVPDVVHHSEKKDFSLASPSPWEREEKEKPPAGTTPNYPCTTRSILRKQRVNEAHQLRDEEISQLEELGTRSSKQEERLRTLRLEQEFQRRAEEMHGQDDDEDDDELLERAENRERILRMQEDLERTRQRRLEWENEQRLKQQQQRIHVDLLQEQEGRLSTLRLEEVTRKKELEATKEAEEMLLKEARRRQEEEIRNHSLHNSQPSSGHQRLDNLLFSSGQAGLDTPPALPTSPPPLDSELGPSMGGNSTQRLDVDAPLPEKPTSAPPAPPERKSSYEVTSGQAPVSKYPSVLRNGDVSHPTTQKKVSFHDSKLETEITNDNSYTLDDIDEGLGTPPPNANSSFGSSVLNSSFGSTPGVIGAQEVYRDPRQRIEAERYQQQLNTSTRSASLGPEKLSFREKMKMFALETGQDESPKDKVKISKAQREIENRVTGPPATAAATSS